MRKLLTTLLVLPLILLCACGGNKEKSEQSDTIVSNTEDVVGDQTENFKRYTAERGDDYIMEIAQGVINSGYDKEQVIQMIVSLNVDESVARNYFNKNWSKIERAVASIAESEGIVIASADSAQVASSYATRYGYGEIDEDGKPDPSGVYLITDKVNKRYVLTVNKDKTAQLCREENYGSGNGIIYGSWQQVNFLQYWPMFSFRLRDLEEKAPIVFSEDQTMPELSMTLYEGKLYAGHQEAKAKDPTRCVQIRRYK